MKKFIELFELVIQSAKKTKDAKKLKEITKIGEELSVLAKNPDKITEAQVAILADKLKEFQQGASKGEGVASLDISDDQRQINQIIKKGDSYDEPATLAYTEKKIDPNDPNYFVKTAEEARIQVEQEAKSLFDNGVFTKEQYLDELARIKENYGEGSSLYTSAQKADGTYETPRPVDDFDDGKSYSSFDEMQRDRKVGAFAEKPEDVSNYDELVEAGIYEPGTMNPGPNHPDVKAGIIEGSFEEMSNPLIDILDTELKIQNSTLAEIKAMDAQIQDLVDQGKFSDARIVADRLKEFKNKLKAGDADATIIPPNRTLNAAGGRIGFQDGSDDLPNKKPAERFFGEDAAKKGFPMGRRAFLGGLGAGIASLFIPRGAAKVATTAAKAAPEIAAQGMPSWFPLLVNKIKSQGKQTKVATGGRNPENVYTLKVDGNEYTLTEDAVNGNMDVFTRGDDFQQVSFEYIPPTEMRRPDGKAFTEDAEFYASEFQKGGDDIPDYENTLGGIEDLKLGISSIEEFAKKGNKTPAEKLDEIADEFKRATTKEDTSGFANGGRVGYKNGGGVGTLFKETRI